MDDSLDPHTKGFTPRRLLRRFMEVTEVQDTPLPLRTRRATLKNASTLKAETATKRRRKSRQSTGGRDEAHTSMQSSSLMDQTLITSVIQGGNQTYANIVAPDSDSSSLIASPDIEKAAKWQKGKGKRKRKLEEASLPAGMVPKAASKKKSKKTVLPATDASAAPARKEDVSGEEDITQKDGPIEPQPHTPEPATEVSVARDPSLLIPSTIASSKGGDGETAQVLTMPPDVSSVSSLSMLSDQTYDILSESSDNTLSNVVETKRRFKDQITSRRLNLPSVIEVLRTKKSTNSKTVDGIGDTLVVPDLQTPTPVKSPEAIHEASKEASNFSRSTQDISHISHISDISDIIHPPRDFRDDEKFTVGTMHQPNSSNDPEENTSMAHVHQQESSSRKSVGEATVTTPTLTRSSLRKSVGEATAITPTPTKSSPRKSVGVVTATTPTRSSLRKSVGEVTATATTPTRSFLRKSVGQASTPTPTKSAQRKSVGQATTTTTPTKSAQRKSVGQATTTTTPTKSAQRKSVGQASTPTPTKSAQRKSVGQASTPTPTKSAQRKSVGQATTATTPTKSAQRKSVGQATTTTTPTKSAQRKSVGQATTTTTPTKSAQRKSVGQASTPTPTKSAQRKSVGQATTTTTTPTKSAQRKSVGQASTPTPTKSAQRKSVGQATTTTTTPTKSAQRKSVGQASTPTPTKSAQRKSVGQATTTTTTPTKSAQRKSVGQATTTTTPTKSAQRKSVGENITFTLVSPQTDEAVKDISRASKTAQHSSTAITAESSTESTDGTSSAPQMEIESLDAAENDVSTQSERAGLVLPSYNEDKSPDKERISSSLPENVAEETSLNDGENHISLIPASVRHSSHDSSKNMTNASTINLQKGETSLAKAKTAAAPKEQSLAPVSTARVRQMTMKEFLLELKTKPMPPPVPKPKPLLASLFGTTESSKTPAKPHQRLGLKKGKKKSQLPTTYSRSVTKELYTHFARSRVTSDALDEMMKASEVLWQNLTRDVCACMTARNTSKQIEAEDVEKVMRRVGLITSKQSLNVLVEEMLPRELWDLFLPFPEPGRNPFTPFTGPFFNPEAAADLEEEDV